MKTYIIKAAGLSYCGIFKSSWHALDHALEQFGNVAISVRRMA